jgi:hypothetical protein
VIDDMMAQMRRMEWNRAARLKALRLSPRRTYLKRLEPRNRAIAEAAIVREPIPNSHAELWITYTPGRNEFLQIREQAAVDPKFAELLKLTLELCDPDALNGYVAFDKRHAPRLPARDGGPVKYIPVHGGCTYHVKDSYAAVWGFDSMHAYSERQPRTDLDWARGQCLILYVGLLKAEELWPEFRRAGRERQCEIAQSVADLLPGTPIEDLGMGVLLNLMTGEI